MPPKNEISLEGGTLYFLDSEKMSELGSVTEGDLTCESGYADDKVYIQNINQREVTFEIEGERNNNWMLTKCGRCGKEFPITMKYGLLSDWLCPQCTYIKRYLDSIL